MWALPNGVLDSKTKFSAKSGFSLPGDLRMALGKPNNLRLSLSKTHQKSTSNLEPNCLSFLVAFHSPLVPLWLPFESQITNIVNRSIFEAMTDIQINFNKKLTHQKNEINTRFQGHPLGSRASKSMLVFIWLISLHMCLEWRHSFQEKTSIWSRYQWELILVVITMNVH